MNNVVNRIGTIVYGLIIGFFGVSHFLNAAQMAKNVPEYLPSQIVWVYVTGAALALAAVAIIINVQSRIAAYLLFLLLLIFIVTVNVPGFLNESNAIIKNGFLKDILKDGAMAAAALIVAARGK